MKILRNLCLLLSVVLIGAGSGMAYDVYMGYKKGQDEYRDLDEDVVSEEDGLYTSTGTGYAKETEDATTDLTGQTKTTSKIKTVELHLPKDAPKHKRINWKSLKHKNEDCIAWLQLPCIDISYPVMQTEDNDFYLHRDMNKEDLFAGSLFADYHNNKNFKDFNTIIYGHNMRDGTMFGKVKDMNDQSVIDKCPYFWIYTPDTDILCHIFSWHIAGTSSSTYTVQFKDAQSHQKWIDEMKSASEIKTSAEVEETDRVVTLSTCYSDTGHRRVVHGVQEYVLKDKASVKYKLIYDLPSEKEKESETETEETTP